MDRTLEADDLQKSESGPNFELSKPPGYEIKPQLNILKFDVDGDGVPDTFEGENGGASGAAQAADAAVRRRAAAAPQIAQPPR